MSASASTKVASSSSASAGMKRSRSEVQLMRDEKSEPAVEVLAAVRELASEAGKSGWVLAEKVIEHLQEKDSEGDWNKLVVVTELSMLSEGPQRTLVLAVDSEREAMVSPIPEALLAEARRLFTDATPMGNTTAGALRMHLFDEIGKTGSRGLNYKSVRRTGLKNTDTAKLINDLQRARLVTHVSASGGHRKTYLCNWVEPHDSLKGSIWHDNKCNIDNGFRESTEIVVRGLIGRTLAGRALAPVRVSELVREVNSTQFTQLKFEERDLVSLLQLLVWEGVLVAGDDADTYVAVQPRPPAPAQHPSLDAKPLAAGVSTVPCWNCPVFDVCQPGGQISPSACVYYDVEEVWRQPTQLLRHQKASE